MINFREFSKPRYLFPLLTACVVISLFVFLKFKLDNEKSVNVQLKDVLNDALQEKEQLTQRIAEIDKEIQEKEQRILRLSDAASLRDSLDNAQKVIEQLNADISRINTERTALQNTNMNLTAKIQGLTRELTRNVDELKAAREDLSKTGTEQLKKKTDDLSRSTGLKDQELAGLKDDVKRLQQLNHELAQKNAEIEKKALEARQAGTLKGGRDSVEIGSSIQNLKETIAGKDEEIRNLQARFDVLSGDSRGSAGQQKKLGDLLAKNSELAQRVADLEAQLSAAKQQRSGSAGFDAADRDRLGKLSELLVKKELEIDSIRKEALNAKSDLVSLQTKLASLEASANQNKGGVERARDLENKMFSLQSRMNELQESLQQKSALADSLQKNLSYLAQQVGKKDEEMRLLQSRYSTIDVSSREELERQKARYEEINMLYASLKTQVEQFSDALNLKDAELDQKKKETSQYREEIAALRERAESMEKELTEAKDRQRKMLDDLISSVKLNTMLQEKIRGGQVSQTPPATVQQQKADDLKRRIEIMLEPKGR